MHFVIFGLTASSSWGNGHATLWRALMKALTRRNHTVIFFEKDVPYYASTRDGWQPPPGAVLRIYDSLEAIRREVELHLRQADVAMITSYCPDAPLASEMVLGSPAPVRSFYDLDTPVTLDALSSGREVSYLPPGGLAGFDLVLSYTGGNALHELESRLGARTVAPLYGSVDPDTHAPTQPRDDFRGALNYLGTYAADRQAAVEELFIRPAQQMPQERFILAGAQYPPDFPWTGNIFFLQHLEPALHPALFCSARATLNVTRRAMAQYGYCPSGRLFEAAACGACILSDWWEGLDTFFTPAEQILRVDSTADVISALTQSEVDLRKVGAAARERVLSEHTAHHRAMQLESYCNQIAAGAGSLAHSA